MRELVLPRSQSAMMMSATRHLHGVTKYMTARKAANISLCLAEMLLRRPVLRSHPFYLRIETSPYCNLRCPGCLLGGADLVESNPAHRSDRIMSFELFKESVRDFLPYLIKANLYDEGEPLLNTEIYEMIAFLSENRVASCVSTNLSLKLPERHMRRLVSCGLTTLNVSVDGATQESYATYRKGGDLDLVVSNVRTLTRMKREAGSALHIELQFLEFPHNRGERAAVRALAAELGVDRFTVAEGCSTLGWEGTRFTGSEAARRKMGCYQLWVSTTVNSIGEVGCCDYGEDHGMPNVGLAANYDAGGLRNHPSLVALRRTFRDDSAPLDAVCRHCNLAVWRERRSGRGPG
jgi:pyruvate-formate lyase-activating enzyme